MIHSPKSCHLTARSRFSWSVLIFFVHQAFFNIKLRILFKYWFFRFLLLPFDGLCFLSKFSFRDLSICNNAPLLFQFLFLTVVLKGNGDLILDVFKTNSSQLRCFLLTIFDLQALLPSSIYACFDLYRWNKLSLCFNLPNSLNLFISCPLFEAKFDEEI